MTYRPDLSKLLEAARALPACMRERAVLLLLAAAADREARPIGPPSIRRDTTTQYREDRAR
jgi:hypothetical protein